MKRFINRQTYIFCLFFFIPLLSGIIYLLAFFPGIMSYDSIFQWDQASRFEFNNWHPAFHTIIIWVLTRIKYSPAFVVLFQIFASSSVLAYGFSAFKSLGVPITLLIIVDIIISFIPLNGMMMITLWKDILFGIAVLLATIYLLKIIVTRGAWLTTGVNWLFLGLVLAFISLLRHNGFPIAVGIVLPLFFIYSYRKFALRSLVVATLFYATIVGPVYEIFKVDREFTQPTGVVLIHPLAAYVNAGTEVTENEREYLNGFYPLEKGWPYSCYDATVFFYQGVSFAPVQNEPGTAIKILWKYTKTSPAVLAGHFYCLSSFVWSLPQPTGVFLETVYTENQDLWLTPEWQQYSPFIDRNSKLPGVQIWLTDVIKRSTEINDSPYDYGLVFWRPAIYLYLFLASVLFLFFRKKSRFELLLLIPISIQSVTIALTAQMQAIRYQYPVYLVSMLFTIPLMYLAVSRINLLDSPKD